MTHILRHKLRHCLIIHW